MNEWMGKKKKERNEEKGERDFFSFFIFQGITTVKCNGRSQLLYFFRSSDDIFIHNRYECVMESKRKGQERKKWIHGNSLLLQRKQKNRKERAERETGKLCNRHGDCVHEWVSLVVFFSPLSWRDVISVILMENDITHTLKNTCKRVCVRRKEKEKKGENIIKKESDPSFPGFYLLVVSYMCRIFCFGRCMQRKKKKCFRCILHFFYFLEHKRTGKKCI